MSERAASVSLEVFAVAVGTTAKNGGTIEDVMKLTGIENLATANQKLVKLRKLMKDAGKDVPALTRRTRSASTKQTVGSKAVEALAAIMAEGQSA